MISPATRDALYAVRLERERQEAKWAEKRDEGLEWFSCADHRMPDGDKLAVLMEEVGEVARELYDARAEKREPSANLHTELVQLAAVAVAWIECIEDGPQPADVVEPPTTVLDLVESAAARRARRAAASIRTKFRDADAGEYSTSALFYVSRNEVEAVLDAVDEGRL